MKTVLQQMLANYKTDTFENQQNAFKEIVQEITLCALARTNFFTQAAFYGGTALRIFYGLDRFSEDLDFSLLKPDRKFSLDPYLTAIEKELAAYGLQFSLQEKKKSVPTAIKTAYLKGNAQELLGQFFDQQNLSLGPAGLLKIKLELDTNPPPLATFENKYRLRPSHYQVKLYDAPSLFAGKIGALLCRSWANRIKGRDLYDYTFYLSREIKVNFAHLKARLQHAGKIKDHAKFSLEDLIDLLHQRFNAIDYEAAKNDVRQFMHDTRQLDLWNAEFFTAITNKLQIGEKNGGGGEN